MSSEAVRTATRPADSIVARLAHLECVIEHGREAMAATADALSEIRDRKLYKAAGYKRFDDYVHVRWNMSSSRAYQLIDFASLRREACDRVEDEALERSHVADIDLRLREPRQKRAAS